MFSPLTVVTVLNSFTVLYARRTNPHCGRHYLGVGHFYRQTCSANTEGCSFQERKEMIGNKLEEGAKVPERRVGDYALPV